MRYISKYFLSIGIWNVIKLLILITHGCIICSIMTLIKTIEDCQLKHQVNTADCGPSNLKSLHQSRWTGRGIPTTCNSWGSSPGGSPASSPCRYSSTRASPPRAWVCQSRESAADIDSEETFSDCWPLLYYLGQTVVTIVWPLHTIVLHHTIIKGSLETNVLQDSPHTH